MPSTLPRAQVPLRLKQDATYVLVGGLGGLGRAQAVFMAENGARHIAFISRSGDARAEAKAVMKTLAEAGVEAKAYAGDAADSSQLKEILDDISRSMPPIRGVVQGAMVLADSLFHSISYEQLVAATRPKVRGEQTASLGHPYRENKRGKKKKRNHANTDFQGLGTSMSFCQQISTSS